MYRRGKHVRGKEVEPERPPPPAHQGWFAHSGRDTEGVVAMYNRTPSTRLSAGGRGSVTRPLAFSNNPLRWGLGIECASAIGIGENVA